MILGVSIHPSSTVPEPFPPQEPRSAPQRERLGRCRALGSLRVGPLARDLTYSGDAREPALQIRVDAADKSYGVAVTCGRVDAEKRLHVCDAVA